MSNEPFQDLVAKVEAEPDTRRKIWIVREYDEKRNGTKNSQIKSIAAKVKSLEMVLGMLVFWLTEARKFVLEFRRKNPKFTHEGVVQDPMGVNVIEKGIEKVLAQACDPAKAVEEMGWEQEPPCGICGKIESCCQKDRCRHLWCRDIEDALRAENKLFREAVKKAAFKWSRCCDLWQDSLGGMHCTECGQKTFVMLREVQEVLGVRKDCEPIPAARQRTEKEPETVAQSQISGKPLSEYYLKKIVGGAYCFVSPEGAGEQMKEMAIEIMSLRQASVLKLVSERGDKR